MKFPVITRRRHEHELAEMQARIDDLERIVAGYKAPFDALNEAIAWRFEKRQADQIYGTFRKEGGRDA